MISHPDLPKPLGPYSPVVRAGDMLYVSAQAGVDPQTGQVPHGIAAECRQALDNIRRALEASGSSIVKVVKITLFYTRIEDLPEINAVFHEVFPTAPPARSAAIVGLAGGRSISIDAIAAT